MELKRKGDIYTIDKDRFMKELFSHREKAAMLSILLNLNTLNVDYLTSRFKCTNANCKVSSCSVDVELNVKDCETDETVRIYCYRMKRNGNTFEFNSKIDIEIGIDL